MLGERNPESQGEVPQTGEGVLGKSRLGGFTLGRPQETEPSSGSPSQTNRQKTLEQRLTQATAQVAHQPGDQSIGSTLVHKLTAQVANRPINPRVEELEGRLITYRNMKAAAEEGLAVALEGRLITYRNRLQQLLDQGSLTEEAFKRISHEFVDIFAEKNFLTIVRENEDLQAITNDINRLTQRIKTGIAVRTEGITVLDSLEAFISEGRIAIAEKTRILF